MTRQEFTTMVESFIEGTNYIVNGLDTEKYVDALYEDYLVEKKDASAVVARVFPRILKDIRIVFEYQAAERKFKEYGMDAFVTTTQE